MLTLKPIAKFLPLDDNSFITASPVIDSLTKEPRWFPSYDFLSHLWHLGKTHGGHKSSACKNFLIAAHVDIFGVYPAPGTSFDVIKSRCSYRLAMESIRIHNKTPSIKFLQNYNAVMCFDDKDPYQGCTPDLMDLGMRMMLMDDFVKEEQSHETKPNILNERELRLAKLAIAKRHYKYTTIMQDSSWKKQKETLTRLQTEIHDLQQDIAAYQGAQTCP